MTPSAHHAEIAGESCEYLAAEGEQLDTTLVIGVLSGMIVGAVVAGFFVRSLVRATQKKARRAERDLAEARRAAAEQSLEAVTLVEAVVRVLDKTAGDAHGTVNSHASRQHKLTAAIAQFNAKMESSSDPETDGQIVAAARQATEDLSSRERALVDALDGLRRRLELFESVVQSVSSDDRMADHKMDDLTAAAAESLRSAGNMDNVLRGLQETASETTTLSTQVAAEAERGYRAVHSTLDEIERIRSRTGAARTTISKLGERVADIGHIVKVIGEVTEKTNLLALNASIIAAQAGAHGRSFAVVAQEIKALAHRTASSTKEISEQIRGVQEESDRATTAMAEGVAAVTEGFQVAIAAGDALDAIRKSAKGAHRKVAQMAKVLGQQSLAAQRVVDAAAQVSDRASSFANSVRGQSSIAERLRSAAVDVHNSAGELQLLVGEHTTSSTTICVEAIEGLAERMVMFRRRELELRAAMRELESGAQGGKRFGDEMEARWAAVDEAAARLRDSVGGLSAN